MPPTLKGDLWPLFHREATLTYIGGIVYARYKACTSELSLTDSMALRGKLKGDEEAVSSGCLGAKQLGLVIGRDREVYSHVQKCSLVSPEAKTKVEAYGKSKKMPAAIRTPPGTAAASGGGDWCRSTDQSPTISPPPPAKCRKTASKIGEYAAFGDCFRHNKDTHSRLIADFISVCKVPFNVVSSPQFRRIQEFYLVTPERTMKSGLVVHPAKIRADMLPLRYSDAVVRSRARIGSSLLAQSA
jgi:hypothetical protein